MDTGVEMRTNSAGTIIETSQTPSNDVEESSLTSSLSPALAQPAPHPLGSVPSPPPPPLSSIMPTTGTEESIPNLPSELKTAKKTAGKQRKGKSQAAPGAGAATTITLKKKEPRSKPSGIYVVPRHFRYVGICRLRFVIGVSDCLSFFLSLHIDDDQFRAIERLCTRQKEGWICSSSQGTPEFIRIRIVPTTQGKQQGNQPTSNDDSTPDAFSPPFQMQNCSNYNCNYYHHRRRLFKYQKINNNQQSSHTDLKPSN